MPKARLHTPPIVRIVPDGVFDAFGWCTSDWLDWRAPDPGDSWGWDPSVPLRSDDSRRMVFVMHEECGFLPREYAALHAFNMNFTDEWALAPYAIDDATDGLFEKNVTPRSVLWLAADNLNSLFWGLHDWSHFHNHGPFDQRAWTELQCDAAALTWIGLNRQALAITDAAWTKLRDDVIALATQRFKAENIGGQLDETQAMSIVKLGDSTHSGAIGFDGGNSLIAACRGPLTHVKIRGNHKCE